MRHLFIRNLQLFLGRRFVCVCVKNTHPSILVVLVLALRKHPYVYLLIYHFRPQSAGGQVDTAC